MNEETKPLSSKAGLPPGALIHVGSRKAGKQKISVIDYNAKEISETVCQSVEECFPYKDKNTVSWINVDGLHNTKNIAAIGDHFELHPLLLEDVLDTHHRPKAEEFDNYLFLTLKMLGIGKDRQSVVSEQVSLILGKGWVISFQEQEGDIFEALRQRLRENKGTVRQHGADYLLYRLLDTVVDNYFFVIEHISDTAEKLEKKVLNTTGNTALQEIQQLKKQLSNLRKSVSPLREAVSLLQKESTDLIKENTIRYLRDVYEHVIQINETIDSQRDIITGIMDLYLSGISNKMNQIMKVLTIISTIFIPLTFIAGIYGMNFNNIPELQWRYGYPAVWVLMIIIVIGMFIYFRRKKWL